MFFKKQLLERLKAEGLPHTLRSLLIYERRGVVKRPTGLPTQNGSWRVYTQEEIEEVVAALRQHRVEHPYGRKVVRDLP